jgi:hypothetical protein
MMLFVSGAVTQQKIQFGSGLGMDPRLQPVLEPHFAEGGLACRIARERENIAPAQAVKLPSQACFNGARMGADVQDSHPVASATGG